jgi:CheY-like chemotaxis protein
MKTVRTQPLVLIVDDETDFLEIASRKLAGSGLETFVTTDGYEAIAKAEELQPDLVLSDVYMIPGPNGWELALELHRNPRTRNIKLVFFTTLSDPWTEIPIEARLAISKELGTVTVFSKVSDVETLGEKVKECITRHEIDHS